jgi:hypothetical protein
VNTEISTVWHKIQGMANDFIILLPNIVLVVIDQIVFNNFEGTVEQIQSHAVAGNGTSNHQTPTQRDR